MLKCSMFGHATGNRVVLDALDDEINAESVVMLCVEVTIGLSEYITTSPSKWVRASINMLPLQWYLGQFSLVSLFLILVLHVLQLFYPFTLADSHCLLFIDTWCISKYVERFGGTLRKHCCLSGRNRRGYA